MQQTSPKSASKAPKEKSAPSPQPLQEGMKNGLQDLFLTTLKDIYYAEKQILKQLPRLAKAAKSEELKQAFETHREQTVGQVERLDEVFKILGKKAQGVTCEAIEGIIEEGKEIMEEFKGNDVLDVGLVGAATAVEHYEMARYESLVMIAGQLGMKDAEKLLQQTLAEEEETDEILAECCEKLFLQAA